MEPLKEENIAERYKTIFKEISDALSAAKINYAAADIEKAKSIIDQSIAHLLTVLGKFQQAAPENNSAECRALHDAWRSTFTNIYNREDELEIDGDTAEAVQFCLNEVQRYIRTHPDINLPPGLGLG